MGLNNFNHAKREDAIFLVLVIIMKVNVKDRQIIIIGGINIYQI